MDAWRDGGVNDWCLGALDLLRESAPAEREVGGAAAVGEEAEVPDAVEAVGQRVQEKAADEFVRRELHDLHGAVLAIVLPGERHMVVFDRDEAAVGDGDPVCVAAEIRERLGGSAEGPLGVDHPGGAAHGGDERVEPRGLGQTGLITEEPQSAGVEGVLQAFEKQSSKELCERLDGEE